MLNEGFIVEERLEIFTIARFHFRCNKLGRKLIMLYILCAQFLFSRLTVKRSPPRLRVFNVVSQKAFFMIERSSAIERRLKPLSVSRCSLLVNFSINRSEAFAKFLRNVSLRTMAVANRCFVPIQLQLNLIRRKNRS